MIISISGKIGTGKDKVADIIQWLFVMADKKEKEPEFAEELDLYSYKSYQFWKENKVALDSQIIDHKKWATKIKEFTCLLFGCTMEQLNDQDFKHKDLGETYKSYSVSYECITEEFNISGNETFYSKQELDDFVNVELEEEYGEYECMKYTVTETSMTPILFMQLLGTEFGRKMIHPNIWVNALMREYTEDCKWVISDTRFPNEIDLEEIILRLKVIKDVPQYDHYSEVALDNYEDWDYIIDNNVSEEELVKTIIKIFEEKSFIEL